jgi:nuclear receptor subfamily 1 group D protein 3
MMIFFSIEIGFPELSQDDQLILIKIGFFEVWLGHVSRLINSQEGTMTLTDGVTLSKQQMDLIFDVIFFFFSFFFH